MMNNSNNKSDYKKPRKNFLKLFKLVWRGFKDFSSGSTLHGLKYLSEKITIIEKLFWAATFIASIIMCSCLIIKVKSKWENSPVIVTFNEKVIPVWQVPFPAITICPQIKCQKTVYNYTKEVEKENANKNNNIVPPQDQRFYDISLICQENRYNNLNITNATMVHNIRNVAPTVWTWRCLWRDDYSKRCSELLNAVLTRQGICYTFNTLPAEEMFNNKSIHKDFQYLDTKNTTEWDQKPELNNDQEPYPRRGQQNGVKADLRIYFMEHIGDRDVMCNSINHGFRVFMHHPDDMPQSSLYFYSVLPNQHTSLAAKISMVTTTDSLKGYSPEKRQCYFPSERTLKYFKVYTQNNCELECLSKYTYKRCKCVWFHMPHDNSSQICTSSSESCVEEASRELSYKDIDSIENSNDACNCLPSCTSVAYDAEVLKTEYSYKNYIKTKLMLDMNYNFSEEFLNNTEFSSLDVYFKESKFVSMHRSELFGTTDFLANCGGLLSLFMGFSFLSIVEIVYFLTLRIFCRLWRKKENINNLKIDKII